jgi:hypothetical protein
VSRNRARFFALAGMPHFYFDTRDGADFIRDEIGLELDGIEAAQDEATRGLADFAKDAIPGSLRRELAVEVRDGADGGLPSGAKQGHSGPNDKAESKKGNRSNEIEMGKNRQGRCTCQGDGQSGQPNDSAIVHVGNCASGK